MLVASRPITTSKHTGPIRGSLIMGRLLDAMAVRRVSEELCLSLDVRRLDDPNMPPDFRSARDWLANNTPVFVHPLSDKAIAGYALLKDIHNDPVLILRVDGPRPVYAQGETTLNFFLLCVIVLGLVCAAAVISLMDRSVLTRLSRMIAEIDRISINGDPSARVTSRGRDELSHLASSTNRMLSAMEQSQQGLAKREQDMSTLVEIHRRLLAHEGDNDWYAHALEPLGRAAQASRTYLFENQSDEAGRLMMIQRAEWCTEGITPQMDNPAFRCRPYDVFPGWADTLGHGDVITSKVSDLPRTAREILEPQGVRAILILPILTNNGFFGFIGFDNCTEDREWEPAEAGRLRLGAAAISLAIDRNSADEGLRHAHEELESRVEERTAELATANQALQAEILDRKRAERELAKAKEAAEAANRSKSVFLANMSHEIRTPMTAILGFVDLLVEEVACCHRCPSHQDCAARTRAYEHMATIKRNGEHLLEIINGILDLSKIEAGRFDIESMPCSPCRIVADVASLMHVRAKERNLALNVEWLGPIPETIQTDPTRLRQILINLIANAIKFTESGGVRLVVRMAEGPETPRTPGSVPEACTPAPGPRLQFDVIDTGVGLTPEQIAKLFRPFMQADASTTRKYGGTGLGLTVSKRLANMLGGDITIESRPKEGSTFRVTIATGPLERTRMIEDPANVLPAPRRGQDAPEPSPQLHCRVLLAEDGPDNQRLITFLLRKAGATVTIADNGNTAVDLATGAWTEGNPFDVILMDMQMPFLDGYGATRLLRSHGYPGPIIALTANAMTSDRGKCLAAGCNEFATKPIDREKLVALLARFCERDASVTAPSSSARVPGPAAGASTTAEPSGPLFSDFANDPDMVAVIREFVDELPGKLAALRQCVAVQDLSTLARLAHQLKGAAGGYGFNVITDSARNLEAAARVADDVKMLNAAVEDLAALCQRACVAPPPA